MATTKIEHGNAGKWNNGQSSDTRSMVILAAVWLMLFSSAGVLTMALPDDFALDAENGAAAPAPDSVPAVPYSPSLYVNQAKEIEPQPPTF